MFRCRISCSAISARCWRCRTQTSTSAPPSPPEIWTACWILYARRRRREKLESSRLPVFATEPDLRRLIRFLSDLRILPAEFLSLDPDSPVARPEDGGLGKLHRPLDRSRSSPVVAHYLVFRRHDHSAGARHRSRDGAGDERSFSRPRAAARRRTYSLGNPHSSFLSDVALHLQ